jgi:hypothetical protein
MEASQSIVAFFEDFDSSKGSKAIAVTVGIIMGLP